MKNITHSTLQKIMLFCLFVFSSSGYAQRFTVTLDNFTSTANTFEVDVILIVDEPAVGVRLHAVTTAINYNPAILNGGTPCSTTDCGSWSLIAGTTAPEITADGGLNPWWLTARSPFNYENLITNGHLRIVQLQKVSSLVDLLPGSYRIGRFKLENTVPWAVDSDPELWLSSTIALGATNTAINFSLLDTPTVIRNYTTDVLNPSNEPGVTLGYTEGAPMLRILNSSLATVSPEASTEIATAFPNPFSNTFNLNLTTVSNEMVQVNVYDVLGKVIENLKVEANGISSLSIGERYATGIYNVKVTQGDKTQVLRLIKN